MSSKLLASDWAFHAQLARTIGYTTYGGAEIGECLAAVANLTPRDYEGWYQAWFALAKQAYKRPTGVRSSQNTNHEAYAGYLCASNYARTAFFFLEAEQDSRVEEALSFSKQAFKRYLEAANIEHDSIAVQYDNMQLPGYVYYAPQFGRTSRPYIIDTGGGDSTLEEQYFNAIPALARGYHYVTFEGPGQGSVLRLQEQPFLHNWESVIKIIVDYCDLHTTLTGQLKALYGVSFGGYLAARAACFEKRLDALILDPGIIKPSAFLLSKFPQELQQDILSQHWERSEAYFQALEKRDPQFYYVLKSRCFRFGTTSISELLYTVLSYTCEGLIDRIACPTLIIDNELEHLTKGQAKLLFDYLTCQKKYLYFESKTGMGGHCQPLARRQTLEHILGWLDQVILKI